MESEVPSCEALELEPQAEEAGGKEPGDGLTALSARKPREAYAVSKVTEGLHSGATCIGICPAGAAPALSLRASHGCLQRGSLGTLDGGGIETSVALAAPPPI